MAKVNIDAMAAEIMQCLDLYRANTIESVKQAVEETAKETALELREKSPKRTGVYAKNWSHKRYQGSGRWYGSMIVYNKAPTYRLTHLLEKGHASRNGGRVEPEPHIASAEEIAHTKLYTKLLRRLRYRD